MAKKPTNPQIGAKLGAARAGRLLRKLEVEREVREIVAERLQSYDNMIDGFVREMFDRGSSYAEIKRYYGTKNHDTIKEIIDRTISPDSIDVLSESYSYDDETKILTATYQNQGSKNLTGTATIGVWADRAEIYPYLLLPIKGVTTPQADEKYNRNEIVAALNFEHGEFYSEAMAYLETQSVDPIRGWELPRESPKESLDITPVVEDDSKYEPADAPQDLRVFLDKDDDEYGGFDE